MKKKDRQKEIEALHKRIAELEVELGEKKDGPV